MAKKIVKSTASREEIKNAPAAYFKSLTLENVKCFKGKHTIDLSDGNGKPANWTVILGNNNTGKTTILKALVGLSAVEFVSETAKKHGDTHTYVAPLYSKYKLLDLLNGIEKGFVRSEIFVSKNGDFITFNRPPFTWEYGGFIPFALIEDLVNLSTFPYSTHRRISEGFSGNSDNDIDEIEDQYRNFIKNTDLENAEEWILQLSLSEKLGRAKAKDILNQIHNILTSGLLPDIKGFEIKSEGEGAIFSNFVLFDTDYGKVHLQDLGYGYQSMMAWVLDLVRRMVERYPDSKSPLEEPAIVLVDEIDLHLHPEWQRKIIAHLTKYFPNTQFIVTAHSPLIVQSADNINVVILRKEGDHTIIEQPKMRNFRGWTVEEILSDLMDLDGKTMSETYLHWINEFTEGIENDDFEKAQNAYKELDKILHPRSELRKLFRLEMTSLTPSV
jgi:predicted ATPase